MDLGLHHDCSLLLASRVILSVLSNGGLASWPWFFSPYFGLFGSSPLLSPLTFILFSCHFLHFYFIVLYKGCTNILLHSHVKHLVLYFIGLWSCEWFTQIQKERIQGIPTRHIWGNRSETPIEQQLTIMNTGEWRFACRVYCCFVISGLAALPHYKTASLDHYWLSLFPIILSQKMNPWYYWKLVPSTH